MSEKPSMPGSKKSMRPYDRPSTCSRVTMAMVLRPGLRLSSVLATTFSSTPFSMGMSCWLAEEVLRCILYVGWLPLVSSCFWISIKAVMRPFLSLSLSSAVSPLTKLSMPLYFMRLYNSLVVSLFFARATSTEGEPPPLMEPKIVINTIGKNKLNIMVEGLLVMPRKLALVMANIAFH